MQKIHKCNRLLGIVSKGVKHSAGLWSDISGGERHIERNERLYPINEEIFNRTVLPIIEKNYLCKGRPPKVSHYQVFCGILYV
jgi:hypothetical protein